MRLLLLLLLWLAVPVLPILIPMRKKLTNQRRKDIDIMMGSFCDRASVMICALCHQVPMCQTMRCWSWR